MTRRQLKINLIIYLSFLIISIIFLIVFWGTINHVPIIAFIIPMTILLILIIYKKRIKVLYIIGYITACIGIIFSTFFTTMTATGESMLPTMKDGWRLVYQQNYKVKRNDIVVAYAPMFYNPNEKHIVLKRVLGIKGDRVVTKTRWDDYSMSMITSYSINEVGILYSTYSLIEPHLNEEGYIISDVYFLVGDNRDNSYDSRYYGFVLKEDILGKVLMHSKPNDIHNINNKMQFICDIICLNCTTIKEHI